MSRAPLRWHVRPDPQGVAAALAAAIEAQAEDALDARGAYLIVLSGGSTPRLLFGELRGIATDWARWHVYFADERCVPRDDPERNDTMARSIWLDRVPIPPERIHAIPAELGAVAAAAAYARDLRGVGPFDTALLGLGEDGHTASLFPGRPAGDEPDAPDVLPVHDAPKPPPERVSLSAKRLGSSHHVALLVTGDAKRRAVAALFRGEPIPAAKIVPPQGVDVWLDAAAAADIRSDIGADPT